MSHETIVELVDRILARDRALRVAAAVEGAVRARQAVPANPMKGQTAYHKAKPVRGVTAGSRPSVRRM